MNSTNVEEWLPLDRLAPGFDQHRLPSTDLLSGRTATLLAADGRGWEFEFTTSAAVRWSRTDNTGANAYADAYQAYQMRDELFFIDIVCSADQRTSVSVVLDSASARALIALSEIGTGTGAGTAVKHEFISAAVRGQGDPAPVVQYERSRDLIGERMLYVYSDEHAYEHVYLNDDWYTWHCLAGPEYGQADTDECTTYRIDDGVYLFAWREKVIPCAAVVVLDLGELRSTGKLYGLAEDGRTVVNFTMGARAHRLGTTTYPAPFRPHRSF